VNLSLEGRDIERRKCVTKQKFEELGGVEVVKSERDEVVRKIPCSRLVITAARLFILIRIAE
jgi:hypothetical protein